MNFLSFFEGYLFRSAPAFHLIGGLIINRRKIMPVSRFFESRPLSVFQSYEIFFSISLVHKEDRGFLGGFVCQIRLKSVDIKIL